MSAEPLWPVVFTVHRQLERAIPADYLRVDPRRTPEMILSRGWSISTARLPGFLLEHLRSGSIAVGQEVDFAQLEAYLNTRVLAEAVRRRRRDGSLHLLR
jgi:hypothetical protein